MSITQIDLKGLKMEIKLEWEQEQEIVRNYLKECIEDIIQFNIEERKNELKAYLYVLADNLYIGDFVNYAEEKNLSKFCKKIYKAYDIKKEDYLYPKRVD